MGAFTTPYWIVGSEVNEPIFMNLNLKRSKSIGFELRGVVIDLICTKHDEPIGQIDQFRPKKVSTAPPIGLLPGRNLARCLRV
jgi:hypothetical protein